MLLALTVTLAVLGADAPAKNPTGVMPKARGYMLEVTQATGAALLKQGDHIDVVAAVTDPETKRASAVMLLQNVIVLFNKSGHVSLLVIPEEAVLLSLARATGTITFVLRDPNDVEVLEQKKAETVKTMLGP